VWDVPIWDSLPDWLFNLSLLPERSVGCGCNTVSLNYLN
jgi:hypothetical protein